MKVGIACKIVSMFLVKALPAKRGSRHLLVIKLDGIGDYILFRNMLIYIRNSKRFEKHKITFLGNSEWREIFDRFDKSAADNVIWIDKKKLKKNIYYRFSLLWRVRSLATSDVLNCVFSRSILLDDAFAFVATGATKIAMKGDNINRGENNKGIDGIIYSDIYETGGGGVFESVVNSQFVEYVLNIKNVSIAIGFNEASAIAKPIERYIVLFLGAGNPRRKWPIENFLKCAEYASDKFNLEPVLCGGPGDVEDARKFLDRYKGPAHNYTAKTTLTEYIQLVRHAKLTVSVDTGPLHIAAATGCPVIGLFSGKFYKRFAPYPKEIEPEFYPVYPDFVDELIATHDKILYDIFKMENEIIRFIPPDKVILQMKKIKTLKVDELSDRDGPMHAGN
jgi:ADP-heptose:LPS heptosyltransferase